MTKLEKPLSRLVDVGGREIIVTLFPADAGIQAHIKLRETGKHSSYKAIYIDSPPPKQP